MRVLNGTSTDGLARQVRDELIAAGFNVVSVGSAANVPVAKTSIIYRAEPHQLRADAGERRRERPPQAVTDASAGSNIDADDRPGLVGLATTVGGRRARRQAPRERRRRPQGEQRDVRDLRPGLTPS